MIPKSKNWSEPKSYHDLVARFPLVVLRNDEHLDSAIEIMEELIAMELDEGQESYLAVLENLIEAYEDEHVHIPEASESDVLRLLMESNGFTQSSLAKKIGVAQSTISDVLSGERSLTKDHIKRLSDFFGVGPGVFFARGS